MPEDATAPSERAMAFLRRLHPVTRLIIAAGVLHLCGDVIAALSALSLWKIAHAAGQVSIGLMLFSSAHALASSVSFFGTAATVEYLFRIWREMVLMRERNQSL